MTELKKLGDAIVLMEAIKSTLQDNPKRVNEETRKQRFHQAQDVMKYLRDTRYALIMANEKAENAQKEVKERTAAAAAAAQQESAARQKEAERIENESKQAAGCQP